MYYALPDDYVKFTPKAYGYTDRSPDEKLTVNIPESMVQGTEYTSFPDGFVVIFSSELLYTPEVLNTISSVMSQLETLDKVGYCLSPFDFVTVEKKGSRLALVPMSPVADGEEWTEETAQIFKERLLNDDMARNYETTTRQNRM